MGSFPKAEDPPHRDGVRARQKKCTAAGCSFSIFSSDASYLCHFATEFIALDGGYSCESGRKQNRGRKEGAEGEEEVVKTGRRTVLLQENRKDFVVSKPVSSYFCAFFKGHLLQLWKQHVVFLAASNNKPYGDASSWALQYCLNFILLYFQDRSCFKWHGLFF